MAYFQWSKVMSVGVSALDSDHRCLIRIINLLQDVDDKEAARTTIDTVLDTLIRYGWFHFAREERVMDACGFPGASFHRSEHEGFARYIHSLKARYGAGADPGVARDLLDYLTTWLRHHILIQDMAFKPYVRSASDAEDVARTAAPSLTPAMNEKQACDA